MSKTKRGSSRNAVSVCIVSDKSVYVQIKKRNGQKLPKHGWQLVSLPDGPVWIRRSETGVLEVTEEPP
jgi:hypothetical protein